MAKKQSNYYKNSFDPSQRVLNIAQAIADKLGIQTPIDKTFSVAIPDEVQKGFRQQTANTSNPSRPRAQAIGYDFSKNTLYVVFRDGTWWEYRNCPVIHWQNLQRAESTGKYLKTSGLDGWGDMGPANLNDDGGPGGGMSSSSKEMLSYAAEISSSMQRGME